MRIYEELFIVTPEATEEEIDALTGQVEGIVTQAGGGVDKIDKWGVRKLAYRVAKKNEGFYVLMQFHCGAETVREIERRLRVADQVIKFLTVRIDEKLKWLEKRKKAREKRAAKRPAPPQPQAAPAAPAPAAPAAPEEAAAPVPGAPAAEVTTEQASEE